MNEQLELYRIFYLARYVRVHFLCLKQTLFYLRFMGGELFTAIYELNTEDFNFVYRNKKRTELINS